MAGGHGPLAPAMVPERADGGGADLQRMAETDGRAQDDCRELRAARAEGAVSSDREDWLAVRAREAVRRAEVAEQAAEAAAERHVATLARLDHQAAQRSADDAEAQQSGASAPAAGVAPTSLAAASWAERSGSTASNAQFLDDAAQLKLLQAVAVSDRVSASTEEVLHAAVMQCTAWGDLNAQMTERLARLTRKVEDGTCDGAEVVSWKLAELLVRQLQDQAWSEEALQVKLTTLKTMRALLREGAAGFKWALMATAAESAEALAQMHGLSEGLRPAEATLVDKVAAEASGVLRDGETLNRFDGQRKAADEGEVGLMRGLADKIGDAVGKVIQVQIQTISVATGEVVVIVTLVSMAARSQNRKTQLLRPP